MFWMYSHQNLLQDGMQDVGEKRIEDDAKVWGLKIGRMAFLLLKTAEEWEFHLYLIIRKLLKTFTRAIHRVVGGNLRNHRRREI